MRGADRATTVWGFSVAAVVATMVVAAIPDPSSRLGIILYLVPVTLATGLLVLAAARIPRPERRPWLWLAGSMAVALVGEFASAPYELTESEVWPTPAEAFFVIGLLWLAVAVLAINRHRSHVTHRGDVLDSVIVAGSACVLSVVFFVLPGMVDDSLSLLARVVSSVYPIIDVMLVYLVVRMIVAPAGRVPAYWLLLGSLVAMLGADVGWNLIQLTSGGDSYPRWMNVLWQLWYLLSALAAHSARTERDVQNESTGSGGGLGVLRLIVLTVASLAPSAILVLLSVSHHLDYPGWLGAGSIMLGILVTVRIWDLLQQLREQTAQVISLASMDSLTGLANRRTWDEQLAQACRPGPLGGRERVVALLDFDHFKAYNDRHGHQAGDDLLRAAAANWTEMLGGEGLLARWGGEEFAVLLVDNRADRALALLERLRVLPDSQTCSVGAAIWDGSEDAETVLRRADQALYTAKTAGRDRLVLARAQQAPKDSGRASDPDDPAAQPHAPDAAHIKSHPG